MTPIRLHRAHRSGALHRLPLTTLAAFCALASILAFGAGPASATKAHVFDSSFGVKGSGPGQFNEPSGVAVNDEMGSVYVVDKGNNRVQEFDATGSTVLAEFNGTAAPTGALENPKDIAIDNSANPLDPSENDVYVSGEVTVAGEAVHVIYKFSESGTYIGQVTSGSGGSPFGELFGVAVDPSGQLWVYQELAPEKSEKDEIDSYSNALENEFAAACKPPRAPFPGLAVDSEGNLYVNTLSETFAKLTSACALIVEPVGSEPTSAASVDSENNQPYLDNLNSLARFTENAELIERFGSESPSEGALTEGAGLAVNSASEEKLVYVADRGDDAVKIFRQIVLATVVTELPTGLGPHKATLNGTVNPEGVPVSACSFEYGETTAYGQVAPCEPSPGSGEAPVAVSAKLTGLTPSKTYHYRLFARNENGPSEGTDQSFTLGPGLDGQSVTEVSADAATFQATINPHRVATSFFFQYGTSTAYGSTIPAPPGLSLSPIEADINVPSQHVQGLSPSTTYHYRLIATQEGEEFPGPDQSFTTQGPGGQLNLPDTRAWELVSPADKHGGVIEAVNGEPGGAVQAAAAGAAISYLANAPTEAAPPGSAGKVQVLSTRGPTDWSSKDIASPHTRATGQGGGIAPEYQLFAEDLAAGIVQPWGLFEERLSPEASEQSPFLRTLGSCSSSCYRPLVSAKAGFSNALAGFGEERFCEEENGGAVEVVCGPRFVGATNDLSHVALISPAPLSAGAGREQLYEWSGGSLSLVSLLPENGAGEELPAPDGTARLGNGLGKGGNPKEGSAKRAISIDGARIFWEEEIGQKTLYMRDSARQQTLQLDAADPACLEEVASTCESGGGRFQIASADGSSVLFTDTHRLSKGAGKAGLGDLYECKLAQEGSGKLGCGPDGPVDLTPERSGESARVQGGVLGASEDDQTVYFVAEGVLSANENERGESASSGNANLYVRRDGATSFIAALAAGDRRNWGAHTEEQPARVSASGRWLTFMSERSLTGYDNRDAASAKPDAEVYLYDAQTGKLSCASCDPSGARPRGVEFGQLHGADKENLVSGQPNQWESPGWVAALTPASPSFRLEESAYQSRALSDSGRLFFNALDELVPQDVNGNWDVYEREPEGVGRCEAGAPGFESGVASCLGLISSGASAQESAFLDASQSGGDVFFLTSAKLTGSDFDANRDVYDAHECTSASPCLPEEVESPPPCATEASCRPAPSPQPQIYGAPASATFAGPGNPLASASSLPLPVGKSTKKKTVKCARGKRLSHGRCVRGKAKRSTNRKRRK